jgi:CheY-like chemotaxis protein
MDPARGATILLVEDNPDHAEFALKALDKGQVLTEVFWVKDGQEALDFLESRRESADAMAPRRPVLILLDIHLPKVNGHEVLCRIKSDPVLRMIPVVMLSTSEQAADIAASYRAGANSYVTKPVAFKEFLERVRSVKGYWVLTNEVPRQ